jgi:hypothetical protein
MLAIVVSAMAVSASAVNAAREVLEEEVRLLFVHVEAKGADCAHLQALD